MDQITTGKFIAERRKARGLTQRELADLLNISDKTVSKWERGGGLPEVSLMLPLCKELDISVNELLSGRKLSDSEYKQNAEENILSLIQEERKKTKFQTIIAVIVFLATFFCGTYIDNVVGIFGDENALSYFANCYWGCHNFNGNRRCRSIGNHLRCVRVP